MYKIFNKMNHEMNVEKFDYRLTKLTISKQIWNCKAESTVLSSRFLVNSKDKLLMNYVVVSSKMTWCCLVVCTRLPVKQVVLQLREVSKGNGLTSINDIRKESNCSLAIKFCD